MLRLVSAHDRTKIQTPQHVCCWDADQGVCDYLGKALKTFSSREPHGPDEVEKAWQAAHAYVRKIRKGNPGARLRIALTKEPLEAGTLVDSKIHLAPMTSKYLRPR